MLASKPLLFRETVAINRDQQSHNVNLRWLTLNPYLRSWGFWKQAVTYWGHDRHPWLSLECRGKTVAQMQETAFVSFRDCSKCLQWSAYEEKRFDSQCWRFPSMISCFCCCGPMVLHHGKAKTFTSMWKSQGEEEGAHTLFSSKGHPPWSGGSHQTPLRGSTTLKCFQSGNQDLNT